MFSFKTFLVRALAISFYLLMTSSFVQAATITVTNNADSGLGSLRQAILDAVDGDTIDFNLSAGNETVISLSRNQINFGTLTVDGANILGSGVPITVQVTTPSVSTYRLFDLWATAGKTITLKNMTLKGGDVSAAVGAAAFGAIISSTGTGNLLVDNCVLRDAKGKTGGALYANSFNAVTISNSTFASNTSTTAGSSMYFEAFAGIATVSNTTVDSNIDLNNSTIRGFNSTLQGTLIINKTTLSNNTYSGTSGLAIETVFVNVEIINSTINNNNRASAATSTLGTIYIMRGTLKMTNSTVALNDSTGVTLNATTAEITNSTIANNANSTSNFDGLYLNSSSLGALTLDMKNTILANNGTGGFDTDFGKNPAATATINDNGYNIVEASSGYAWAGTGTITGDQVNLNLSPTLALNDSVNDTYTLALSAGSVAINTGSTVANNTVTIPVTDQRGLSRAGLTDIGAYEFVPDVTSPTGTISIEAGSAVTNTTAVTLTLTCSDNVACTQMQFSNDNATWPVGWVASATSSAWTLAAGADGVRDVYAQFKDASGNISSTVIKDQISLDTTAPSTAITSPATNITTSDTLRPTISGTSESGASVVVKDGATSLGMVTATGGNWSLAGGGATLTAGVHTFTATATDAAGNAGSASAVVTYTVSADTTVGSTKNISFGGGCILQGGKGQLYPLLPMILLLSIIGVLNRKKHLLSSASFLVLTLSFSFMLPATSDAAETSGKDWRVGGGIGAFKMIASYPGDSETYSKVLPGYLVNLGYMAAPWLETGVLITGGGKGDDTQGLTTITLELPALPQVYAKIRQDIDEDLGFYEVLTLGSLKQEATDSAGNSVFSDNVTIVGLGAGVSWYASNDWTLDAGIFAPNLVQASSGSGLDTSEVGLIVAFNYAFGFASGEATPREVQDVVVAVPMVAPQPVEPIIVPPEPVTVEIIDLEGVYFASGGSDLNGSSAAILDQAVDTLLRRTDINVEVAAHSDNVGRDKSNLLLSERRAQSVRTYLIVHGVSGDRIKAKGYGSNEPVADNGTEIGRAKNRRVELRVQE